MISTRTPEGSPGKCPVCGHNFAMEPSTVPTRDAPCPGCGCLVWFDDPNVLTVRFAEADPLDVLRRLDENLGEVKTAVVRIDFSDVDLFTSEGLGRLIVLHRKLQAKKGRLVLFNINRDVLDVFKITKLDKLLDLEYPLNSTPGCA